MHDGTRVAVTFGQEPHIEAFLVVVVVTKASEVPACQGRSVLRAHHRHVAAGRPDGRATGRPGVNYTFYEANGLGARSFRALPAATRDRPLAPSRRSWPARFGTSVGHSPRPCTLSRQCGCLTTSLAAGDGGSPIRELK